MKLSGPTKREGVRYRTANRWSQQAVFPVDAVQIETRTILVEDEAKPNSTGVPLYARVSPFVAI